MKAEIEYYAQTGKGNTGEALAAARKRALELQIGQVLVASSHGYSAQEAARVFAGTGIEIIAVTISAGFQEEGWCMTPEERRDLEKLGVKVLTAQHSLSGGVEEAFAGGGLLLSAIANTLYCFAQGMKVAVEISIMAAEAGIVAMDREVIAIAGSGSGSDTAIVLVPVYARKFQDLRIREILCKPRVG